MRGGHRAHAPAAAPIRSVTVERDRRTIGEPSASDRRTIRRSAHEASRPRKGDQGRRARRERRACAPAETAEGRVAVVDRQHGIEGGSRAVGAAAWQWGRQQSNGGGSMAMGYSGGGATAVAVAPREWQQARQAQVRQAQLFPPTEAGRHDGSGRSPNRASLAAACPPIGPIGPSGGMPWEATQALPPPPSTAPPLRRRQLLRQAQWPLVEARQLLWGALKH